MSHEKFSQIPRTSRIAAKNSVASLMDRMERDTWIDKRYIVVDGPDCETRHTGCRINSFPTGDCNDRPKSAPCELSRGTREQPLDFLIRGEHRYIPSRSRQCEIHARVCTNLHRWRRFKDLPPFSRNPDRENAYFGACLVAITFHNPVRVYLSWIVPSWVSTIWLWGRRISDRLVACQMVTISLNILWGPGAFAEIGIKAILEISKMEHVHERYIQATRTTGEFKQ